MHFAQKQERDTVCDALLMGGLQGCQVFLTQVRFLLENENMGISKGLRTQAICID